jgi:hypothetical protein
MTAERRTALVRLLAHIDQQIRKEKSLASDESLDAYVRECAAVQLSFRQRSVERLEEMIAECR